MIEKSLDQPANRAIRQFYIALYVLLIQLSCCYQAFAQGYGRYEDDGQSSERFIYKMITSGFGTFVIIFMGMGGLASIFMTREGDSSKKAPILGIAMLLISLLTFAYRVMIRSGMMGHEYIQW